MTYSPLEPPAPGDLRAVAPEEPTRYQEVQSSAEFQQLRRRLRRFVFPMTAFFLAWYFGYVLLADYQHEFMARRVAGNVTVGLLLGLGQFVTTFAITMLYAWWANRRFDPAATELRELIEPRTRGGVR